jgi:hypothetical protein
VALQILYQALQGNSDALMIHLPAFMGYDNEFVADGHRKSRHTRLDSHLPGGCRTKRSLVRHVVARGIRTPKKIRHNFFFWEQKNIFGDKKKIGKKKKMGAKKNYLGSSFFFGSIKETVGQK